MENITNRKLALRHSGWLALAIFIIIFSGPVKKLIELNIDPQLSHIGLLNNAAASLNKKLKDGSRDRHQFIFKITPAQAQQVPPVGLPPVWLLSAIVISIACLYIIEANIYRLKIIAYPFVNSPLLPFYFLYKKIQV